MASNTTDPLNSSSSPKRHSAHIPSTPSTASTSINSTGRRNIVSDSQHLRSNSVQSSNGTPLSARASVRKPTMSSSSIESSQLLDDLRERLAQAELASEELKKNNEALQIRLDDANKEQAKQEEKIHEDEERIEELENAKRDILKQKRELETIFEAERAAVMKEKESSTAREEELQLIIQRLKDSLSNRDSLKPGSTDDLANSRNSSFGGSSSPTTDANHFAPPSLTRNNSARNNSKLLLQKDKLIEELRLELAELQIKCMELDNRGGGRVQELEKHLIEARVTNARLMEENESFQTMLMERTVNGDFSKKHDKRLSGEPENMGSLADELEGLQDDDGDSEIDRIRKLEIEVERQKAENKALTIYINKIIERILKFQGGFETILSNNDDEVDPNASTSPAAQLKTPDKNKELPPPPPKDNESPGLFQKAKNMALDGLGALQKPTKTQEPAPPPSVVENITTAPSIPLSRKASKRQSIILPRRVQSVVEHPNQGAAAVVGNMFRPSEEMSSSSPGPKLASAFEQDETRPTSSASGSDDTEKSRKDALDALTGGGAEKEENKSPSKSPSLDTPSPPRSLNAPDNRQVMSGNKMRPLRLVNEEQQKRANRQSWMPNMTAMSGWFNQNTPGVAPGSTSASTSPNLQSQTSPNPNTNTN